MKKSRAEEGPVIMREGRFVMRYFLENEQIRVEIESFGAELKSLVNKAAGQEYMWEADPVFWGKTSPVLFPFIGKLEGAGYRYGGKRYEIEKHGFARDMEFSCVEQKEDSITFSIESSAETMEKFPFPFRMEISYQVSGNSVTEKLRVTNMGGETMYFSVGGHPAFACPLKNGNEKAYRRTDCFVKLFGQRLEPYQNSEVQSTDIGVPDGLLTGNNTVIEVKDGLIPIREHIFDQDALCLAEQGIEAVALCGADGREYVRMEADCPVWGIWSQPDSNAAYVCLEPWWGICDNKGYEGTLEARPYTNSAEAGKTWERGFKIVIL